MSWKLLILILAIVIFLDITTASASPYVGGIPVPGRTVPILRLFENYGASCRPNQRKDFGMDQLAEILQSFNAEDVAQKVYNSLFFAMGDIQIEKLMGRWYRMVDARRVHNDDCAIFYFDLLSQSEYTATFSSVQYTSKGGEVVMYEGYGRMMGPDPGETFFSTGHPADPCPYFPVKLGGLNLKGEYEYMILSQPLKYPTMVLARDMTVFDSRYRSEVYSYLEKHGFLSPMAALNTRLHFVDSANCRQINPFYDRKQ